MKMSNTPQQKGAQHGLVISSSKTCRPLAPDVLVHPSVPFLSIVSLLGRPTGYIVWSETGGTKASIARRLSIGK